MVIWFLYLTVKPFSVTIISLTIFLSSPCVLIGRKVFKFSNQQLFDQKFTYSICMVIILITQSHLSPLPQRPPVSFAFNFARDALVSLSPFTAIYLRHLSHFPETHLSSLPETHLSPFFFLQAIYLRH